MSYPLPGWTDGDFHNPQPVYLPEFSSPIPGIPNEYLFIQKWQQFRNNFAPAALDGTVFHPVHTTYFLVEEGPRTDMGNGVVQWDRKYAVVPASHDGDPEFANYSFIGLTIDLPGGGTQVRERQNKGVTSNTVYDYFLCPSGTVTDPITGLSFTPTTWGDIPVLLDMQYVEQGTSGGVTYGGVTLPAAILNLAGTVFPTWPTANQYLTMMNDAITNGWNATKSIVIVQPQATGTNIAGTIDTAHSVLGGLIPIEPSRITRWIGPIYQRATRYVLAQ